jgi:hypothetical protein
MNHITATYLETYLDAVPKSKKAGIAVTVAAWFIKNGDKRRARSVLSRVELYCFMDYIYVQAAADPDLAKDLAEIISVFGLGFIFAVKPAEVA